MKSYLTKLQDKYSDRSFFWFQIICKHISNKRNSHFITSRLKSSIVFLRIEIKEVGNNFLLISIKIDSIRSFYCFI